MVELMPWAKLDDRFHDNRKVRRVWRRCPAALGLHVLALTNCAANLTDGLVDHEFVEERAPRAGQREQMTSVLVEAGLWRAVDGGWLIHDFLEFNPTQAQVTAKRLARQEAGRAGGNAKASSKRLANARQIVDVCYDTLPTPEPEPVPTPASQENTSSSDAVATDPEALGSEDPKATTVDRRLCALLRQRATERNPKFKVKSRSRWLTDMRLLRDRDGNTEAEISEAVEWVFRDSFWGGVILSPGNLREHFPTIWDRMQQGAGGDVVSIRDEKHARAERRLAAMQRVAAQRAVNENDGGAA